MIEIKDYYNRLLLKVDADTLIGVNLIEANLTKANLIGANLTKANLTKANLRWAYLIGTNLTGTDLTRVEDLETTLTDRHTKVTDETLLPDDIKWTGKRFVKND